MTPDRIPVESFPLAASDGRQLAARWRPGTEASTRSLVILSALGAPQAYLSWFAMYLARQGWGVLTFDYRGIGQSRQPDLDSHVTADDWVNLDLPAAFAAVQHRTNAAFTGVIAHSVGGQLLGQSPIRSSIDGALFISAQRGMPYLFEGRSRLRIHYAYTLFPLLIRLFGELPVAKWTLPQPCPAQALLQWMRWGRTGSITDCHGNSMESRFADYRGPLTTVVIADDQDYASPASVAALARLYTHAILTESTVSPQDYGLSSLGHFGLFHRHAPRALWDQMEGELRQMSQASYVAVRSDSSTCLFNP